MRDHEYSPFGDDFPFSPATRADEWADQRAWEEIRKVFGFPDAPMAPCDTDDESVIWDGAR